MHDKVLQETTTSMEKCVKAMAHELRPSILCNFSVDFEKPFYAIPNANKYEFTLLIY
jgi:hypothetical protein